MKKKSFLKYTLANNLRGRIKLNAFCRKWSKNNPNNDTIPQNIFPIECVTVGDYSYGELNIVTFDNKTKLRIGRFVSVAQHVTFLLDVEHYTSHLSTYPFKAKILGDPRPETFSKGDIILEDDVWIGYGATIISGVHIGQGAVIAAGAVVTKDVEPYAIVGGIPAKRIRYRFDSEIVSKLNNVKFDNIDIMKNISILYNDVSNDNADDIVNAVNQ